MKRSKIEKAKINKLFNAGFSLLIQYLSRVNLVSLSLVVPRSIFNCQLFQYRNLNIFVSKGEIMDFQMLDNTRTVDNCLLTLTIKEKY